MLEILRRAPGANGSAARGGAGRGKLVGLENDRNVRSIERRLSEQQHRDRAGRISIDELLGGIRQYGACRSRPPGAPGGSGGAS